MDKQTIIENLKKLAKKLGKSPTMKEYYKEYGFLDFYEYGTYTDFLLASDLKSNIKYEISRAEIKEMFKKYIKEHGVPKSTEIPKELPQYSLIKVRFGSYDQFLKELGYRSQRKRYTKEEIVNILRKGIDSGEIKNKDDLSKEGYPYLLTIFNVLKVKTWNKVLKVIDREEAINSKIKYNYTNEEIVQMYIELSNRLNKKKGATIYDVKEYLGFDHALITRRFNKKFSEFKKECFNKI